MSDKADQITERLYQALQFTFKLHGRDARKASSVPYMAHLLAVCALTQQDGGDEDEAIAALLHDALEDKPDETSREEIGQLFGEKVLKIVELSTDTPPEYRGGVKPRWRERKEYYLAHIRTSNPELLRVTLADKVDNARAIYNDYQRLGEDLWKRFNAGREDQIWYYESAVDAFKTAGVHGLLLEELERLVSQIRVSSNSSS